MHSAQCRTEGDHVHALVFLADKAALQSGVYGADGGFFVEQTAIGVGSHFQHFAVGVGSPARIAVAVAHLGSDKAEGSLDLRCGGMLGTLHRATLAGADVNLAVVHLYGCKVGGSLHKVGNLARHSQNAVGAGVEGVEQIVL